MCWCCCWLLLFFAYFLLSTIWGMGTHSGLGEIVVCRVRSVNWLHNFNLTLQQHQPPLQENFPLLRHGTRDAARRHLFTDEVVVVGWNLVSARKLAEMCGHAS